MPRLCSDGCGRIVHHYAQECYPVAPWDPKGLEPRAHHERCHTHTRGTTVLCAYRDDDPARHDKCHALYENCTCK